jgi:dTDP-6-deoxy-L-talose 4-dehydrogenase (NAD+)
MTDDPRPILVTGAAGFVGAALVRTLRSRGLEVAAGVRSSTAVGRLERLPVDAPRVELDLDDPDAGQQRLDTLAPRAIVHLAWHARPEDYLHALDNRGSLAASRTLFAAAARRGTPIVAAGTCLEYAPARRPLREDDPSEANSEYAKCKLAALAFARTLEGAPGWRFTWARLFHIHGPDEAPGRLLPSIARALRAGQRFDLPAGDQVRDHLHVDDVAAALALLVERGHSEIVNVCSGKPVSLRELAWTMGEAIGRPELLRFGAKESAPGMQHLLGDPARLRSLGFRPAHSDLRADLRALARVW